MDVERNRRNALFSLLFVAVLVTLCAVLAVLQYRWIGDVSAADHQKLLGSLHASLQRFSQGFNSEVTTAGVAVSPRNLQVDAAGLERAVGDRYARWRQASAHSGLFKRVSLVFIEDDSLVLKNLDFQKGTFGQMEWPAAWQEFRERLLGRLSREPSRRFQGFGRTSMAELSLIELPQFRPPSETGRQGEREREREGPGFFFGRGRELGWLVLELDLDYVGTVVLPELLKQHLGDGITPNYQVEIVGKEFPSTVIYRSGGNQVGSHADGSVGLFEVQYEQFLRFGDGAGNRGRRAGPPPPFNADRGRWLMSVRHKAGSLDAVVEQARIRNLLVTSGVLLLMMLAILALVQFTRRAQRLAELQMEFVAGVSHELRTPLSVIRTAAHNLGGRVISDASRVQRYGALIEEQAERLTGIVEQVLQFSNAKAGRAIGAKEVVGVDGLIDQSLDACAKIVEESRCMVERRVDEGLPPVFGDPTALKHVLLNLVSNAAKYGSEGGWIGISASAVEGKSPMVEIRVADRGAGIPKSELELIFDPFYRGKRAVEDQIHGTGVGLSLVKRIIEAHGGKVTAQSEPGKGTEFIVRIPAAAVDQINEFADSTH